MELAVERAREGQAAGRGDERRVECVQEEGFLKQLKIGVFATERERGGGKGGVEAQGENLVNDLDWKGFDGSDGATDWERVMVG